jgi:hypothetical protein
MFTLSLADKIIVREYERYRAALGGTAHELVNQQELVRLGHPYYNAKSGGGEGHLEVAKNIYYCNKDLAHMVVSLKPFGCMPSTQSDGAQAAVVNQYSDMIFIPIETSGEGDITPTAGCRWRWEKPSSRARRNSTPRWSKPAIRWSRFANTSLPIASCGVRSRASRIKRGSSAGREFRGACGDADGCGPRVCQHEASPTGNGDGLNPLVRDESSGGSLSPLWSHSHDCDQ